MEGSFITLNFEVSGKQISGFCMPISDQFHETYAVILQGYQSFCVWTDNAKTNWYKSKHVFVGTDVFNHIILFLSPDIRN